MGGMTITRLACTGGNVGSSSRLAEAAQQRAGPGSPARTHLGPKCGERGSLAQTEPARQGSRPVLLNLSEHFLLLNSYPKRMFLSRVTGQCGLHRPGGAWETSCHNVLQLPAGQEPESEQQEEGDKTGRRRRRREDSASAVGQA